MIILRTRDEVEKIRAASLIVAEVLAELAAAVRPGVTALELDRLAERRLRERKARPAFKGYLGYPASLCVSVNEEIVHAIPRAERVLREGDIASLDFGAVVDGYFGDAAVTVPVGTVSPEAARLVRVTEECLERGIDEARGGHRLEDISAAVQGHAEGAGFSVVREFVGHGIGKNLHESPQVPNFGIAGRGMRLRAGMVLAIEPMINAGGPGVRILPDGWTAITADGSLSAHFEHTVAILEEGPVVLSRL